LWQRNKINLQSAQHGNTALPVTFLETDAVNLIQDFQPHWLMPHADDFTFAQKQSRLDCRHIKTEFV
jgi:hypothetical protein